MEGTCAVQVERWFAQRAVQVDAVSGQLEATGRVLALAQAAGVTAGLPDLATAARCLQDTLVAGTPPPKQDTCAGHFCKRFSWCRYSTYRALSSAGHACSRYHVVQALSSAGPSCCRVTPSRVPTETSAVPARPAVFAALAPESKSQEGARLPV